MRRLVCAFIVTNHRRQVFAVAVKLLSMNAWKHGKYDNSDIIVICAVSSKHFQCVCRHTKSCPAGDCFLNNTTSLVENQNDLELDFKVFFLC